MLRLLVWWENSIQASIYTMITHSLFIKVHDFLVNILRGSRMNSIWKGKYYYFLYIYTYEWWHVYIVQFNHHHHITRLNHMLDSHQHDEDLSIIFFFPNIYTHFFNFNQILSVQSAINVSINFHYKDYCLTAYQQEI